MEQKKYPSAIWPVNEATANIAFSWLQHLRWGAVLCQAILILLAYTYLKIALPITFRSGNVSGHNSFDNPPVFHRRTDESFHLSVPGSHRDRSNFNAG